MKNIVILGGGFAGVAAAIKLKKTLKNSRAKVTLIDKNSYHLFTPSLFEVATSEEPQRNIAIPFDKIFDGNIETVKGLVEKIDTEKKSILLKNGTAINFDYLLISLGSEPAYFNIPGLQENSVGFKTLSDAVKIKNKINSMCCKEGLCNRKVQAIIGGGGFAGTELAAELLTYKDRIARQNKLDKNCLQLTIIQGSDRVLKELDNHVSELAQKRLTTPNVHFAFGGHIVKVDSEKVYTDNDKSYPYDILIWTGGVEANALAAKNGFPVNKRGQIKVNDYLQMVGNDHIFVAGDMAGFIDPKTQKTVPNVAQVAEEQGATAAENIVRLIKNKELKPYHYRHFGYIVPLKGRFAVAELMYGLHFDGILGWILQQIVLLRYLLGILPFGIAFKRWNIFELELEQG
ncbi:MAG TPA: NAD(P)/FAD-dependent oxidoreductase [Candidatus Saccharimonadales bacterium]|nr:NAD(P)/FAD-dependent oxidoreductase [Candidatus Saccharimonadales bacterium]